MADPETIAARLDALLQSQSRIEARLAALETRMQRVAETASRLALMAGNAKEAASGRQALLTSIENRLARLEAEASGRTG